MQNFFSKNTLVPRNSGLGARPHESERQRGAAAEAAAIAAFEPLGCDEFRGLLHAEEHLEVELYVVTERHEPGRASASPRFERSDPYSELAAFVALGSFFDNRRSRPRNAMAGPSAAPAA